MATGIAIDKSASLDHVNLKEQACRNNAPAPFLSIKIHRADWSTLNLRPGEPLPVRLLDILADKINDVGRRL